MITMIIIAIGGVIITAMAYQQGSSMGNMTLLGVAFVYYCLFIELKNRSKKRKYDKEHPGLNNEEDKDKLKKNTGTKKKRHK